MNEKLAVDQSRAGIGYQFGAIEYYDGIDLWSPSGFQTWLREKIETTKIESITEDLLALSSNVGNCRAAFASYFGNDYRRFSEIVGFVVDSGDNLIEHYGRALRLLIKPNVESILNTKAILLDLVQEIVREGKSPFRLEVECMARLAYAASLRENGLFAEAEANAARALDYAQMIEAPITQSKALSELAAIRYAKGEITEKMYLQAMEKFA